MAYTVYCVHADRGPWVRSLRDRLDAAVAGHGDPAGTVQVREGYVPECQRDRNSPAVAVYLGSPAGAASAECRQQVDEALADRVLVLPVVDDERNFKTHTPAPLYPFNGEAWLGDDALPRIVRFVLEALGLEERQRMVFLSHRRSDARAVAEQLHDELIKNRFWPFVDRFDIDPAEDVQQRIHAALEETAFVVLVESPAAVTSQWVLEEVTYALSASLGMLIVSFPGAAELPGTRDLPRERLNEKGDLAGGQDGQPRLEADALRRIVRRVEAIHAKAMVRRRRRLVLPTRTAFEPAGFAVAERPGDVLLVTGPGPGEAAGQARADSWCTSRPARRNPVISAGWIASGTTSVIHGPRRCSSTTSSRCRGMPGTCWTGA